MIVACPVSFGVQAQAAGLACPSAMAVAPLATAVTAVSAVTAAAGFAAAPKAWRAEFERVRQLAPVDLVDRPLYLQATETADRLQ